MSAPVAVYPTLTRAKLMLVIAGYQMSCWVALVLIGGLSGIDAVSSIGMVLLPSYIMAGFVKRSAGSWVFRLVLHSTTKISNANPRDACIRGWYKRSIGQFTAGTEDGSE